MPLLVLIGCLRHHAMAEASAAPGVAPGDLVGAERARHGRREDIKLARDRDVVEGRAGHAEILGQHLVRRVLEPVAQQERVVFVEIAVVEDQQEFAAVRTEALDRVRNAARKIPEIADADVVDEIAALRIDRGDAGSAVEHVGPFGRLVPMQFAHAAGIQAHVHAGDILGNASSRTVTCRVQPPDSSRMWESRTRSAGSAACRDRSRAAPADRGSAGPARGCADRDRCRRVRALRLRYGFAGLRARRCCCRQQSTGSRRRQ